uniref:MATE family efflux transporter n=1 Tax=Thermofilum pendens TaxID=2269 RepID=A0A7C4FAW7_THEPE
MSRLPGQARLDSYRERILNGPVLRTLLWLGLPPMVVQLVHVAYGVADSLWLSMYYEKAIAVPRQVFPVLMLFGAAVNALSAAGSAFLSQLVGARVYDEVRVEASRFFTAGFTLGVLLSTALFLLRPLIFQHIVVTPPEIFDYVMLYSAVMSLDSVLMAAVMPLSTLLNSFGETRAPSAVNVIALLVNMVLDPFLVLGIGPFPRLGVVGASATDVLGKVITLLGYHLLLSRRFGWLKLGFNFSFTAEWVRAVLGISSPVFIMMSTSSLAFMLQQRIVNMLGVVVATAYSIGFVVLDIADGILWGLLGAVSTMVGQCLGAGDARRAREVALRASAFVAAAVTIGAVFVYTLRVQLVSVFASSPEVVNESVRFLETIVVGLPFFAVFMVGNSTGRGSGHTLVPTLIGMTRLWLIRVAGSYLLAIQLGMGSLGVWLAIMASNIIGGSLMLAWIAKGDWTKPVVKKAARAPAGAGVAATGT